MGNARWGWHQTVAKTVNAPWWEREEDRTADDDRLSWGMWALLAGLLVVILPLAVLLWPVSALQGWIARHRRHGGRWVKWQK